MGLVFKSLNRDNIKITPYTAHKQWIVTDSASAAALGIKVYVGVYASGLFAPSDPDQGDPLAEGTTTDGQYKKLIHASIDRLYYNGADSPYDTYCNMNPYEQIRELNDKVTVFSVPQQIFGDAIKPGTFQMTFSASDSGTRILKDDGLGNIYDSSDTNVYISQTANLLHVGYWDNYSYMGGYTSSTGATSDYWPYIENRVESKYNVVAKSYNTRPTNGSSGTDQSNYGAAARYGFWTGVVDPKAAGVAPLKSSTEDMSYTVLEGSGRMTFDEDFAIVAKIRTTSDSYTQQSHSFQEAIQDTAGTRKAGYSPWQTIVTKAEWFSDHIPFEISLNNSTKKIYATRKSKAGAQTQITSSAITDEQWTTILFQKTGSNLELYIDNVIQGTAVADLADGLTTKTWTPIHIGARRYGKRAVVQPDIGDTNSKPKWKYVNHIRPFFGHVDEVSIYDSAFSTANRNALHTSPSAQADTPGNNTNRVGNIMYEHGIITITTPYAGQYSGKSTKYYYHKAGESGVSYFSDLQFKGSHNVKEHIYICNVLDGEYNTTENITVREKYDARNPNLKSFVTSSYFSPYITTIGLYDKNCNLCAIGKLAQPVKNPDDYDISFQIRFDTNSD